MKPHVCLPLAILIGISAARAATMTDRFADRPRISGSSETLNADTTLATIEAGENRDMHGGNSARTTWAEWVAPANGWVTIDAGGSFRYGIFAVYSGSSIADLKTAARGTYTGSQTPAFARFPVTAGDAYQIALDGNYSGSHGIGRLNIHLDPGVTPDSEVGADGFAGRRTLKGHDAYGIANNYPATAEPFQPNHGGYRDVWWEWTAPSTGTATIDTLECDLDTLLTVYSGSPAGSPPWDELDMVAQNDNVPNSKSSRVTFQTEAGRTYQIKVAGNYSGSRGNIVLRLSLKTNSAPAAVPGTNHFIHRPDLAGTKAAGVACNTYATADPFEPVQYSEYGRSVWWRWVAPADGEVVIDTEGSEFDTTLRIFQGEDIEDLTQVAAGDDVQGAKWSRAAIQAVKGRAYQIRVDSDSGWGNIVLHLARTAAPEIDVVHTKKIRLVDGRGTLNFGKVRKGRRSAVRMITVRNTGDAALKGILLRSDGTGARHFRVGRLPKTALAPGQSMSFTVRFQPKAKGRMKAALRIHSNDRDESPFDIQIAGNGR
ncbi:MAG: choice-of-anchor D domain-containing protein [Akkermansiaceae bacterium]|nr:choice-of-anchor D domain-containing protein [Akkermansiaceae bacterium]MCP5545177.1 choice-of-anchor D domain-containing protein [Akkermansiaceae bacterium]